VKALGCVCEVVGVGYALVDSDRSVLDEAELSVPATHQDRGDQLSWLLAEVEDLLVRCQADVVWVLRAGGGRFAASPERHEVEAVVQIAAHRAGIRCALRTREQVRASAGVAKGKGAYDTLLKRPDVQARSNKERRERYLAAVTALEVTSG
jgi:hypothetical protein